MLHSCDFHPKQCALYAWASNSRRRQPTYGVVQGEAPPDALPETVAVPRCNYCVSSAVLYFLSWPSFCSEDYFFVHIYIYWYDEVEARCFKQCNNMFFSAPSFVVDNWIAVITFRMTKNILEERKRLKLSPSFLCYYREKAYKEMPACSTPNTQVLQTTPAESERSLTVAAGVHHLIVECTAYVRHEHYVICIRLTSPVFIFIA